MTDAKPADGTYYFAEFGLRSKGAPPILYRSRIVGEVHYDELWDVRDHVWSDTNVLTDYKYGHGDNNLVALTDEQAERIRVDGVEWFDATQRWTVHYRKVDETPSEVRYEFFTESATTPTAQKSSPSRRQRRCRALADERPTSCRKRLGQSSRPSMRPDPGRRKGPCPTPS